MDLKDDGSFNWMGRHREQKGSGPEITGKNETFGTSDAEGDAEAADAEAEAEDPDEDDETPGDDADG